MQQHNYFDIDLYLDSEKPVEETKQELILGPSRGLVIRLLARTAKKAQFILQDLLLLSRHGSYFVRLKGCQQSLQPRRLNLLISKGLVLEELLS